MARAKLTTVMIVPTGVGAAIGGFAGDAIPVARAIAQVSDRLITHPNVLNGAQLYWPIDNALYVEGYALDRFAAGEWNLLPVFCNRIGLLLDQGIEAPLRDRQLQAADAARATLGLSITEVVVTDQPLNISLQTAESGATWGTLEHPDSLLRATEHLIQTQRVDAIAVITRFPDDIEPQSLNPYRQGRGVDPLAGAEAVISHLICQQFQIPCAHAPALTPLPLDRSTHPRAAAEEIGYTFLPSVLAGLSRAPQLISTIEQPHSGSIHQASSIHRDQVDVVIVPASCCGGSAILSFAQTSTQIMTVADNGTAMQAFPEALGLRTTPVQSYLEVLGRLTALRAGIDPDSLTARGYETLMEI